jgi:hypothetical protein
MVDDGELPTSIAAAFPRFCLQYVVERCHAKEVQPID